MYDQLEPDAQRTLNYLARRLLDGQKAYGKLDLASDPRDWKKERGEELADLLVYTAFESLKQTLRGYCAPPARGCAEATVTWRHDDSACRPIDDCDIEVMRKIVATDGSTG